MQHGGSLSQPQHPDHKDYGGRGIEVCVEWLDNPKSFITYVEQLPHCGEPGQTINRIDNDRGYAPGNIEWATKSAQAYNRRAASRKRRLTLDQEAEMCRLYATGEFTQREIGQRFGVSRSQAQRVLSMGEQCGWLPSPIEVPRSLRRLWSA